MRSSGYIRRKGLILTLFVICFLTIRCHWILHSGPLTVLLLYSVNSTTREGGEIRWQSTLFSSRTPFRGLPPCVKLSFIVFYFHHTVVTGDGNISSNCSFFHFSAAARQAFITPHDKAHLNGCPEVWRYNRTLWDSYFTVWQPVSKAAFIAAEGTGHIVSLQGFPRVHLFVAPHHILVFYF